MLVSGSNVVAYIIGSVSVTVIKSPATFYCHLGYRRGLTLLCKTKLGTALLLEELNLLGTAWLKDLV